MLQISTDLIRKLAITKQRLAGERPPATTDGLLELFRAIRCVQIDPIRAVERTQYLVPFSRLGPYEPGLLDRLAYEEKQVFEYWAHAASYVLTEDYPIHNHMMRNLRYGNGVSAKRFQDWLASNEPFADHIVDLIKREGPKHPGEIEDLDQTRWRGETEGVWYTGRNTPRMIASLWDRGDLMVARRDGVKKYWDLAERVHPDWMPREEFSPYEVTRHAIEHALRALGVAPLRHIKNHFTRNRYPKLNQAAADLASEGRIIAVEITDSPEPWEKAGVWYIHQDDLGTIENLSKGAWAPRTALLSPFDNLICDRDRTELLWDFFFRIEIYVPAKKREYGYYVMPILQGDQLIGRIDPKMDRKTRTLNIQSVYREPGAPDDPGTTNAIRTEIEALAEFLDAKQISFPTEMPAGWKKISA